MANHPLRTLSQAFERFAKEECYNSSLLYERLSLAIAKDPELLSLAAHARKGERVPNLFFTAAHFLLLKGIKHPVFRFYESLSEAPERREDPYPNFRSFCLEHEGEISKLISSRLVQTNEVRRCACLLPIFAMVSQESYGQPLYMIEIGAAAGLLLLWDHYGYRYGQTLAFGDRDSPVQIECGLRGEGSPLIPDVLPKVSGRLGIDLNPIDLRDPDSRLWLRALIWPEHRERASLLERAIDTAQRDPPELIAADAVEVLPDILNSIPPDSTPCIFRVWTSLPQKTREQLSLLLTQYGQKRDLFVISTVGQRGNEIDLQLTSFVQGVKTVKVLAHCETHGESLEWLA
ncbi:MAG TPA: DUF2332 domain-containing protein [Candidatus Udaeobacter sp.]|nr:DUF2332 domain-containing protein [Candidatus Udaeobacter sp.]